MAAEHGVLKVKLGYQPKFNTILWTGLTQAQKNKMRMTPLDVEGRMVQYPVLPPYPRTYDPRSPTTMPQHEYANWFFKDQEDHIVSVIALPLDQGKCGSCWSFATASMWTDTIRHMLMTIFGAKACFYSKIFNPVRTCTGDIGIENVVKGVVNASSGKTCKKGSDCPSGQCLPTKTCLDLVSVEVRDQISVYYTVGFAPKLKDSCTDKDDFSECLVDCSLVYNDWMRALGPHYALKHQVKELGEVASVCAGCEGNAIVMPLYMFADKGAPLLSQFPIQEWGCVYGTDEMRKTFCTDDFLLSSTNRPAPDLLRADRYGHFVEEDLQDHHPHGIRTMEEWIQAEILNNATVTIGFVVFPVFFTFFQDHPKGIFTYKVLHEAIKSGHADAAGGHAVDVVGWGEEHVDGELIPYWVVRNSWGDHWGDGGFFRFERGIDAKLKRAKLHTYATHFEHEIGTVYYAPWPNPALYTDKDYVTIKVGDREQRVSKRLRTVLTIPPATKCESIRLDEMANKRLIKKCLCEPGYVKNTNNMCVRDLGGDYRAGLGSPGSGRGGSLWWVVGLVLLGVTLLIIWRVMSGRRRP